MMKITHLLAVALLALGALAMPLAALERIEVTLVRTIDGDTARFIVNGEEVRVRFLAVDAPEMGFRMSGGRLVQDPAAYEKGATEATLFVDRMLRGASVIELERDPARPPEDRFGRMLAWVWADGVLVQEELVRHGHATTAFLRPGMLYYDRLRAAERGH